MNGFHLQDILGSEVITSDKKKVDLDKIIPNPDNIYHIDGIDDLADNIEDIGLQQNLVVFDNADGTYTIVSGHRRYNALKKLVYERGLEKFKMVDCLIISHGENPDLVKLKLHSTNVLTRDISAEERLKAVIEVNDLMDNLEKQGIKLKGKRRDILSKQTGMGTTQTQKYLNVAKDATLTESVLAGDISFEKAAEQAKNASELSPNTERKPKTATSFRKKIVTLKDDTDIIRNANKKQIQKLTRLFTEIDEVLSTIESKEQETK